MMLSENLPEDLVKLTEDGSVIHFWARNYNLPDKAMYAEKAGVPLSEALKAWKWKGAPPTYAEFIRESQTMLPGTGSTLSAPDLFYLLCRYSLQQIFMLQVSCGDGAGVMSNWTACIFYPGDRIEIFDRPVRGEENEPHVFPLKSRESISPIAIP